MHKKIGNEIYTGLLSICIKDIRFSNFINIDTKDRINEIFGCGNGVVLVKELIVIENNYKNNIVLINIWPHQKSSSNSLSDNENSSSDKKSFIGLCYDKSLGPSFESKIKLEIELTIAHIQELKSFLKNSKIDSLIFNCRFDNLLVEDDSTLGIGGDSIFIKEKEKGQLYNSIGYIEYITVNSQQKYFNYFFKKDTLEHNYDLDMTRYEDGYMENEKKYIGEYIKQGV